MSKHTGQHGNRPHDHGTSDTGGSFWRMTMQKTSLSHAPEGTTDEI